MKRLMTDNHADAKMVGVVVGIFITLIVSVLVLYSMASGVSFDTATEQQINENRGYTVGQDAYNNSTDKVAIVLGAR